MLTTLSHQSLATATGGQDKLDKQQPANVGDKAFHWALGGAGLGAVLGTIHAVSDVKVRRPLAVIRNWSLAGAAFWGTVAGVGQYAREKNGW